MNGKSLKWAVTGLVFMAALAALLWRFGGGSGNGGKPEIASTNEPRRLSAIRKPLGSALPARQVAIEPAKPPERNFDPYEEWETAKILDNFMVPSANFECANIHEAVEVLRELYAEFGGRNVAFVIEGGDDAGYPAVAEIDKNLSMRELLDLVGGLTGFKAELDEGVVTFRRLPVAADADQIITVRLAGKPEFLVPDEEPDDPFRAAPLPALAPDGWFSKLGIPFADGAGAEIDHETGEWVLTNRKSEMMRAVAVYDVLAGENRETLPAQMVHLQFRNVGEKGGSTFEPKTFSSPPEFQKAMQEYAGRKGVEIMSAPSIVARAGQKAKVEIIREVIYPGDYDAAGNPTSFEVRNVGFSVEIEPKLAGLDQVLLAGRTDFTTLGDLTLEEVVRPDAKWGGKPPAEFLQTKAWTETDLHSHITEFDGALYDGNTAGFPAAEDETSDILQFISAKRLLPSGQPLIPDQPGE